MRLLKHKHFSSESLFGIALIALVLVWISFTNFSPLVFWMIIPLSLLALCRLKCKEKTRLGLDAGVISVAVGVLVFVFMSFLLPDVFMPWVVVALLASVPAAVLAATTFFYLTRPASKHARIHEFEALTFFVVVVIAIAIALPQLFVATTLPADYAFQEAVQDYWEASSSTNFASTSELPGVLIEYRDGYLDEVSALAQYWLENPPRRCIDCIIDTYTALKEPSLAAKEFSLAAMRLDAYLLLLENNPEQFFHVQECVQQAEPALEHVLYDRPSEVPVRAETVFGASLARYVVSSNYFASGFLPTQIASLAQQDAQARIIGIMQSIASSEDEQRAIALMDMQYSRNTAHCPTFF